VKFFERLVLGARQRAIARPADGEPQRVKALRPFAGRRAVQPAQQSVQTACHLQQPIAIRKSSPALELEPVPAIALLFAQPQIG
jgi:hypothetical protein